MLYNGIFGCHGNICYVILINAFLQGTYHRSDQCVYQFWDQSAQNWRIWKTCKNRVLFDVAWRKNGTYHIDCMYIYTILYIARDASTTSTLYENVSSTIAAYGWTQYISNSWHIHWQTWCNIQFPQGSNSQFNFLCSVVLLFQKKHFKSLPGYFLGTLER